MKLIGEYTTAGAALSAQILTGAATLNITRAAAGAGNTAVSASKLSLEKQALAVFPCTVSGATLTVPVRLASLDASSDYTLSEVGLYAKNSSGSEILYKIYRVSQPISVSRDCSLVANLYLSDTVLPGSSVNATVTPAGLLTLEDANELRADISALPTDQDMKGLLDSYTRATTATQSISCSAANLQSTINSLPKAIDKAVTITVASGTFSGSLVIDNFFGRGRLTIKGTSSPVITGTVEITNCSLELVRFEGFTISGSAYKPMESAVLDAAGHGSAVFHVRACACPVHVKSVVINPPASGERTHCGFYVKNTVYCAIDGCTAHTRYAFVAGYQFATVRLTYDTNVGVVPSTGCMFTCYMEYGSILYRQATNAGSMSHATVTGSQYIDCTATGVMP